MLSSARDNVDSGEAKIAEWNKELTEVRQRLDAISGPSKKKISPRYERMRMELVKKTPVDFLKGLKELVDFISKNIAIADIDRYKNDLRTATIDYLSKNIKTVLGNKPATKENVSEITSPFIDALNLPAAEESKFHNSLMDALKIKTAADDDDGVPVSPTDVIERNFETPEQKDEFYSPFLPEYKRTERKLKAPEPKVKEWDVVQHLFGKDIARAKDLREQIEKGSMVTGDAYKEIVKEFLRKQKEIPQKQKFLDLEVKIGDEKVPVKNAGEMFRDLLDEYQEKINKLIQKRTNLQERAVEARNKLKTLSHYVDPETGEFKGFSEEDKKNIANIYLKQLFWELQKYWMTQVGRHNVFGGREYAPYAQIFETFKNVVGAKSNPREMEKIQQIKSQIPELMRINKDISQYAKAEGPNFMKKFTQVYRDRLREKKRLFKDIFAIKSDESLDEKEKQSKIEDLQKGYVSDDKYFREALGAPYKDLRQLVLKRDTIQKQKAGLDSLFEKMLSTADEAMLIRALEAISQKIGKDDAEEKAFIEEQKKKLNKEISETSKMVEEVQMEKKYPEEEKVKEKEEETVKQSSYRSDKNFNMNVFYSPRFQKKLAELTEKAVE
jgi:hypothetical protein